MHDHDVADNDTLAQTRRIALYMAKGHQLTQLQALRLFGCMRLGARIYDLKQLKYKIKPHTVRDARTGKRYARYELLSAPKRAA